MTLAVGKQEEKYTPGLSKGASAIEEIRRLLAVWVPGEDDQTFLTRVRESGLLGQQTADRTRDIVFRVFRRRLLRPTDQPGRWLKRIIERDETSRTFKELLFLYTARAESLLYDFTIERFWPACEAGELYLVVEDVKSFLRETIDNNGRGEPWSPAVQTKISRGVLGALRDFGFLNEERRGRREIVRYYPTDFTVAYLAYELHLAGLTDGLLVEHSDWRLFGLNREQVLNRLDELDKRAGLIVQRAGSVVSITWLHPAMEELIVAYTSGNPTGSRL